MHLQRKLSSSMCWRFLLSLQKGFLNGSAKRHISSSFSTPSSTCDSSKYAANRNTHLIRWSSNSSSSDGVTWLWEANDIAKGFNEASKHGTRNGCIEYTFNSSQPLELEHFQRALERVMRLHPNLRSVLRPRGDSVWYCQLPEVKMDLEIVSDKSNFREDCLALLSNKGFQDSDSLPWRTRVVPRDPDSPCHIEGLREKYPYQYDLNVMINHAVMDGLDIIPFTANLLQSLDWTVCGKPATEEKIGVFEYKNDLEVVLKQRKENLLQDKSRFNIIRSSLPRLGDVPSVIQAFPRPKETKPATKHIERFIDPQLMRRLYTKCSEKRVTFHSFAFSVCNVALAELMRNAEMPGDPYKIASLIFMNLRRYIPSKLHLYGCNTIGLTYMSDVQSNARDFFWEYCKRVNDELHLFYTKEELALDQYIVQGIMEKDIPPFNYTDNPRPVSHDFSSTYVGDMSKSLPVTEHVQLSDMMIIQQMHNFRNSFFQQIFTFRGRTLYNFHYITNYFSDKTANLITDRVFQLFDAIGK